MKKNPHGCTRLLSPIRLGALDVANRIVLAPMDTEFTAADGSVTDLYTAFLRERAAGGAGMILTEFSAVDAEQMMSSLGCYSGRLKAGLNRLVDAVSPWGARIFLQIAHHGGQALQTLTGQRPVAPSEIASPLYTHLPRALTRDEVLQLIEKFVDAAARAQAAGFDGVEVHGAYDYLIGQFISPHCNHRADDFGGSFERRLQFPAAIIAGIRDRCGSDFPVGFKFSAVEDLPGGSDREEGVRIARWAESQGVVYVHVAVTASRVDLTNLSTLYSNADTHSAIGAQIREAIRVPVILTACSRTPEEAERVIADGKADLVAIGRSFLADPAWGTRAAAGTPPRPCILCNRCHQRIMRSRAIHCTVNPRLGEDEGTTTPLTRQAKSVTVVGGGPAGLAAAFAAVDRGHRVTVLEQGSRVGGNLVYAAAHSFKYPMGELLAYYEAKLEASDIDVRLLGTASPDGLMAQPSDVIILAIGARPMLPDVPGITGHQVLLPTDPKVLDAALPPRVVVVGAGLVGLETALHLAEHGKQVDVIDKLDEARLLADEATYVRAHLLTQLAAHGVGLHTGRKLVCIDQHRVRCESAATGEGEEFAADTVVLALGYVPKTELADELRQRSPKAMVISVGDCRRVGNLYTAIQQGHQVGSHL